MFSACEKVGRYSMLETKSVLWRVEFRTDVSRTSALKIPVGFMREAFFDENSRFLGLIFRASLTPLEIDLVNLKTWPEMSSLEGFMDKLFDDVWEADANIVDGTFGSFASARRYGGQSALSFAKIEVDECRAKSAAHMIKHLIDSLDVFEDQLEPALQAPILPFTELVSAHEVANDAWSPKWRMAA
jgi:hypothetical protein